MSATFSSQKTYAAGGNTPIPFFLASGDLNGDGKPDIVMSNGGSTNPNNFAVLLGNGNGTFQAATTFALLGGGTYNATGVVVADFNGDGKQDIVIGNNHYHAIEIHLGNGNGTFQAGTTFAAGQAAWVVKAADLNGDGNMDIVCGLSTVLSVILGNGNGTFKAPVTYACAASGNALRHIAIADFNGDGHPDIAVNDYKTYSVNILIGNGDGTFKAYTTTSTGGLKDIWSVAAGDINGDGKIDIVCGDYTNEKIAILLGNGNGTFQTPTTFGISWRPMDLNLVDIDGDGRIDLVDATYTGDTVFIHLGNGNGTFQYAGAVSGLTVRAWPVADPDLTGDGKPDIIVGDTASHCVTVVTNTTSPWKKLCGQVGGIG